MLALIAEQHGRMARLSHSPAVGRVVAQFAKMEFSDRKRLPSEIDGGYHLD